jgi:hypothetical protein
VPLFLKRQCDRTPRWSSCSARAGRRWPSPRAFRMARDGGDQSEQDAKLAQKLGQLQPFIALFPHKCMGQLYLLDQPDSFLAQGRRALSIVGAHGACHARGQRGPHAAPRRGPAAALRKLALRALALWRRGGAYIHCHTGASTVRVCCSRVICNIRGCEGSDSTRGHHQIRDAHYRPHTHGHTGGTGWP